MKENEKNTTDINMKTRAITRKKEQIAFVHQKIQQNMRECELRNGKLLDEKKKISHHYLALKQKMLAFRDEEGKRLSDLTLNAKDCMDSLNSYLRMGEKILKTAELCRKLETEREKVLPFYESQADGEEIPDT